MREMTSIDIPNWRSQQLIATLRPTMQTTLQQVQQNAAKMFPMLDRETQFKIAAAVHETTFTRWHLSRTFVGALLGLYQQTIQRLRGEPAPTPDTIVPGEFDGVPAQSSGLPRGSGARVVMEIVDAARLLAHASRLLNDLGPHVELFDDDEIRTLTAKTAQGATPMQMLVIAGKSLSTSARGIEQFCGKVMLRSQPRGSN